MNQAWTTLNAIRAHSPCDPGWRKLLKHLGKKKADDEPLELVTVLESNGLDDALWCLRSVPGAASVWRLYAVWCASRLRHLMTDKRSLAALDVAYRHAIGKATDDELDSAGDAAMDAAIDSATWAAWQAAGDAAWDAARYAAWDAAKYAAGYGQSNMLRRVFLCPTMGEAIELLKQEVLK